MTSKNDPSHGATCDGCLMLMYARAAAAAEVRLATIAALHQAITEGPNEGFCDGCDHPWPCPTRETAAPSPHNHDAVGTYANCPGCGTVLPIIPPGEVAES